MNKLAENNLIVTGIPRSGTTLTTSLLDSLSNSVCLSEPAWQASLFKRTNDESELVKRMENDFIKVRKKILNNEPVLDRRNDEGIPLTNYIKYAKDGKTTKNKQARAYNFKVKDKNFLLGMKHNAHYTSILPQLAECSFFSILTVVRHPVPTILSWQKVNFPISRGRLPGAERFWPEIKGISCSKDPLIVKQTKIYDLFIERYLALKDKVYLLKYEVLVRTPSILETMTNKNFESEIGIKDGINNSHYNLKMADSIRESLIRYAPNALKLYSLDDF